MNQAPSNQTGINNGFASQHASQTNPFTADLKGEFTSNFGTNTNAVSQIFKEGGFTGQNRNKYIILGVVAVLVLGLIFYVLSDSGSESDEFADDFAGEESGTDDVAKEEKSATESATEEGEGEAETAAPEASASASASGSATTAAPEATAQPTAMAEGGPVSLQSPADGASLPYDETMGAAEFSWSGGAGTIVFSRSSTMSPEVRRVRVSGSSYSFNNPYPGTWYWKVDTASGSSNVQSFRINSPARRNIAIAQPTANGSIAGNGGAVQWQGDEKVAFYRVEFSQGSWANPQHRFATVNNTVTVQGVAPGQYQMRVGAFSEVAGRWEYTQPITVTVQ